MTLYTNLKETAKYLLRSYPFIRRYAREIDEMYDMTAEELRARNERKFIELFRLAYTQSPFYHRFYSEAGIELEDIKSLADIVKLPVLTKALVKQYGRELLTRSPRGLLTNHTSGTTGTPLTVYESWESLWREQAYFVCFRRRCGFTYGDPLISLRGTLKHSDTCMRVRVSNTLFLSSYNINEHTAEVYHRAISKHLSACPNGKGAIEGYPSALYNLALVFRDKGLDCHIPLAFTSSETMYEHQREMIEKVFHCQLFDHYGTTERTIRLEEDLHHDGYFEDPGYGIVEYLDDYTLSTSLINTAFPLIRYKTDDRIVLKDAQLKDGSFIKSIEGRAIIYIEGKDGTQYSDVGLTFIFKDVANVRLAQFVQRERGRCMLNVVTDPEYSPTDEQRIVELLDEKVGLDNMDFEIRRITQEELNYGRNNKLALVVRL